ncbi:tripartite tricarboxylate transporter substrate-binding protein [Variovorax sp. J31P207]|uniref:Bug family tripartite tricarboxylate transporter substrate binding protein n=1 Tax=Variovorax sp. J31P207 TaxID=3053510 RepID=UPI00257851CE|nr:tripartite tricarboxylate transporter substrate-binding protein [Variovorax sp. J31P207]MDM0066901.1 tripartite tricarboxylate transporter substrate-binding protein [Variovorax sp. J31P207]
MRISRRSLLAAAAAVACASSLQLALAAGYPSQPVRLIVPYSPGGLPDTVARIVGQRLTESLGQSFVVENKPGAGGAVAANTLAQAPADGYTFIVTDGPMLAIPPFVTTKPPFNAQKDFVPVSLIGTAPLYLAVNANVKANNLDELIALAKSKPGALNYGSSGLGSIHHLTAEAMKAGLGINITHVPFKGSGQSVPAMMGGQVDMLFASPPTLMGFVKNGQAKLIAINTAKRAPLTPDVPALSEKIPGFDFAFTVVVLAKPGTPQDAINKINASIASVVKTPAVIEQLQKAGVDPVGASVEQTSAALNAEMQRITAAAKHAGMKPE